MAGHKQVDIARILNISRSTLHKRMDAVPLDDLFIDQILDITGVDLSKMYYTNNTQNTAQEASQPYTQKPKSSNMNQLDLRDRQIKYLLDENEELKSENKRLRALLESRDKRGSKAS